MSARSSSVASVSISAAAVQASFDDLGTPLSDVTFVVVDLETTGGAPADAGITEIGAVKVRGGEVVGQFQTLVNPGVPIPPFVAALTGITDALVASAPPLADVLPTYLEFARGCVVVAHNAPYDVGFLRAACEKHELAWSDPPVVDTARLARVALLADEVPNCKLATLAAHFRTTVRPSHRAFDDARATADVLHRLIERVGNLGVHCLEDLVAFSARVSTAQRTKRHLASDLPSAPGVYVFLDAQGTALYVGTSRNIRTRVRQYFTASEQRRRMAEMIQLAQSVRPIVCSTTLEAKVRELRLIVSEQPRYNRRSRRADAQHWLKLTVESAPRLSVVANVAADHGDGARYLGPFPSRFTAQSAADALLLAFPARTCTTRIAQHPRTDTPGCALAELGRCLAPCTRDGDRDAYDELVHGLRTAMSGDIRTVVRVANDKMAALAAEQRYEDAAMWRERLAHLASASLRTHRLALLSQSSEIVAARPTANHGWDIHVIRFGRLAGAAHVPPEDEPAPVVDALRAKADYVTGRPHPAPAGLAEEALDLLAWLESDGVRLVRADQPLWLPVHCGADSLRRLDEARRAPIDLSVFDDEDVRRSAYPGARPIGPADARTQTRMRTA